MRPDNITAKVNIGFISSHSTTTNVFLVVLRERSLPEERVWEVFKHTLDEYMHHLNRKEAWHRYHCRSLHAVICTRDGEEGSPLMDMIASSQPDPSEILLNALGESA